MAEITRKSSRLRNSVSALALLGLAIGFRPSISVAQNLPTGGVVVAGQATIAQPSATLLNVNTATSRTAIQWQSFSIGAGNTVSIQQPNRSSVTVNSVIGPDPSKIFGALTSNGQVVVANPNGIWFGPNSRVDVSGLVASTANASRAQLQAFAAGGQLKLDQPGKADASVVNEGHISVSDQGLAALVAPSVKNSGIIAARLGQVTLASGTTATVDFYGDGLVSFALGGKVNAAGQSGNAAVANIGTIAAAGGQVLLTAAAAANVVNATINMSGVVQASSATTVGGDIILDGGRTGTVTVSGVADASSSVAKGGTVQVLGNQVALASTAKIDASGATGGGSVAIGGGAKGGGSLPHAAATSIATGAVIAADATVDGDGGQVVAWSDGKTSFAGKITARGAGKGKGGSIETSGHTLDFVGGTVDASAPSGLTGNWLLDPTSLELTTTDQAAIASALSGGTNVTVQTTSDGPSGGFGTSNTADLNGDILVDSASGAGIAWNSGASLTLNAYGSVTVSSGAIISNAGSGSIIFYAGEGGSSTSSINVNASSTVQTAGTVSFINAASSSLIQIGGTVSGGQVFLESNQTVSLLANSQVTATGTGSIYFGPANQSSNPNIDIAGTLTGSGATLNGTNITLEQSATLDLSGSTRFSLSGNLSIPVPRAGLLNSPSVEIDFSGSAVNLGNGNQSEGSLLNLSAAALNALDSGATTNFIVQSGGQISTSGALTFPGSISFTSGAGSTISLDGTLSFNGSGTFNASNQFGSTINIIGNITDTGTGTTNFSTDGTFNDASGSSLTSLGQIHTSQLSPQGSTNISGTITAGSLYIQDSASIAVTSGAVLNAGTGAIQLYAYSVTPAIDIGGTIIGGDVELYARSLTLESTAQLTGSSFLRLSALSALSIGNPQSSAYITNTPSVEIDYSGGSIGLGTFTSSGTGDININTTVLNALDGTTASFTVRDSAPNGSITTGGNLSFPGNLSFIAGPGGSISLSQSNGEAISIGGSANFDASNGGSFQDLGTIANSGTGGLSIYAANALTIGTAPVTSAGAISLQNSGTAGTTTIDGFITGTNVTLSGPSAVNVASGASITATTNGVNIVNYSGTAGITTISGTVSGSNGVAIVNNTAVTLSSGSVINGGTGSVSIQGYYTSPTVDDAGSISGRSISLSSSSLTLEGTALISGTSSVILAAATGFSVPGMQSTAIITNTPSVEIDYSGGSIGLGTLTVGGTGAVNLTAAALNALDSSTTTSFTINDTALGGTIATGGPLSFPGGLTLDVGTLGLLALGGSLSIAGFAEFNANKDNSNTGQIAVTGSITGASSSGIRFDEDNAFSVSEGASINATAGVLDILGYYNTGTTEVDTISGTLSGNGVSIVNNSAVALLSGSVINGGTGSVTIQGYYNPPAIDDAGSISGRSVSLTSSSLTLESTALISGTNSVFLSATTGFSVPGTQSTTIITSSPSVEIDYAGGSIGLGTATVNGTGAVNLTAAALNALDSSATTSFTINDTASGGTIATGGALSFPGGLTLDVGTLGLLALGGSLGITGFAEFNANKDNSQTGQIAVTGTITGASTSGIRFDEDNAFSVSAGASINATAGVLDILGYYNTGTTEVDTIGGTLSGNGVSIINNTAVTLLSGSVINAGTGAAEILGYYTSPAIDDAGVISGGFVSLTSSSLTLEGTALISGTSRVVLSASTGLSVPGAPSTAIITNTPSVEIDYGGGSIGLGTATVNGTGAVNLTTAALNALDSGATTSFTINDTASGGTIATGGALSFPGGLTLDVGTLGLLALGGSLGITGFAEFNANFGGNNTGQIAVTGTITGASTSGIRFDEDNAFSVSAGASINATSGALDILDYYSTDATAVDTIGGALSGNGVSIINNTAVTLLSGSVINGGTGSVSIQGYYSPPAIDDAGSISGSSVLLSSSNLTLESTALISGTSGVRLLATTGFNVPSTQSTAIITNTQSVEIDYSGGSIGLGTATASGTGAINLTVAALNALDAGAASSFTINDSAPNGSITTGGNLTFPGALNLYAGTFGILTLGGSLSIAGAASFNDYYYSSGGQIVVTGTVSDNSISGINLSSNGSINVASGAALIANAGAINIANSGTSGTTIGGTVSGVGVNISDNSALSLASGSVINGGTGSVTIGYYYSQTDAVDLAGSVSGSTVSIYGSTVTLESSAHLSGSSYVYFVAANGLSVNGAPSSSLVTNTPTVYIQYSGGSIGLGTATATGTGALNLSTATLNALGLGTVTSTFSISDTAASGLISIGGTLITPGSLSLSESASSTPINISGTIQAGRIYFSYPLILTGDTFLDALGTGGITTGSIDGAYNLTLNAADGYVNLGAIGAATPLSSLNITATNVTLNATNLTNSLLVNAADSISVDGNLSVSEGPIVLHADTAANGYGTVAFAANATVTSGGALTVFYHPYGYTNIINFSTIAPNASSIQTYLLVDNAYDLSDISNNLSGNYLVNGDIISSPTLFVSSIGSSSTPFTGVFDGQGHTISNVTIDDDSTGDFGLFRDNAGTIRNVTFTNMNVTESGTTSGAGVPTGGLGAIAGQNSGSILNVSVSGALSSTGNSGRGIGGLVGNNQSGGIIQDDTASVTITAAGGYLGGLAGGNSGTITLSNASGSLTASDNETAGGLVASNFGTISQSFAAGAVTVGNGSNVGGLVAVNYGSIAQSYATGTVTAGDSNDAGGQFNGTNAGGLVGWNYQGSITDSFATGSIHIGSVVSGSTENLGALVGLNNANIATSYAAGYLTFGTGATVGGLVGANSGSVTNSYFDTETTGLLTDNGGATGLTTAQLTSGTLPAGFGNPPWTAPAGYLPTLSFQSSPVTTPINNGTSDTVAGTVFTTFGGPGVGGALVELLVDGVDFGLTTAGSAGQYTFTFSKSQISSSTTHETLAYLNGNGLLGSAFYDGAVLPLGGLDIFENTARVTTSSGSLANAFANLQATINAAPSSGSLISVNNGTISTVNNANLAINALGTSFIVDEAITAGSGLVVLQSAGPVTQIQAITAGTLSLPSKVDYNLTNANNSVGTLIGTVNTLAFYDAASFNLGAAGLQATGAATLGSAGLIDLTTSLTAGNLAVNANKIVLENGAAVQSAGDIAFTTNAGGTIQLNQGTLDANTSSGTVSLIGDGITLSLPTINAGALVLDAASQNTSIAFDGTAGAVIITGSYYGNTPTVTIGDASNDITFSGNDGLGTSIFNVKGNTITLDGTSNFTTASGNFVITGTSFIEAAGAVASAQSIQIKADTIDIAGSLTGTGPQSGNALDFQLTSASGSLTLEAGSALFATGQTSNNATLSFQTSSLLIPNTSAVTVNAGSVYIYNPNGPLAQGPGSAAIGIGAASGQLQLSQDILSLLGTGSRSDVFIVGSESNSGPPPTGQTIEFGGNVNLAGKFHFDVPYVVVDQNTVLSNTGTNAGLTFTLFVSGSQFILPSSASIATTGTFTLNGQPIDSQPVFAANVSLLGQISAGAGIDIFADASSSLAYNLTATLGGSLTTSGGAINIGVPVLLAGTGLDILTSGGNITFASTIDGTTANAQSLTINAGSGTVTAGNIGTQTALGDISIIAGSTMLGEVNATMESMGGDVTLSSAITRDSFTANHLTLLGNGSIDTSSDNGIVNIGFIDGAYSLSIDAGTGKILIGKVGSTTQLTSLSLFGGNISVGSVNTSGAQTYTASASMTANGALTAGGLVTLNGSGAYTLINTGNSFTTLVANAGSVALSDSVFLTLGNVTTSGGLSVSDSSGIGLSGSVSGSSVALTGPITLAADTTITTTGGEVTLSGIDGTTNGGQSLTINAGAGNITTGDIGDTIALNTINFSGGIVSLGNVRTTGGQTYNASTSMAPSGAIIAGGLVTLNGSGAYTLINTGNSFTTLAANAGSVALSDSAFLTLGNVTTSGGLSVSDSSGISLSGSVSGSSVALTGPITLAADTTITTTGGDVMLSGIDGTTNGGQSLTINAGAGNITAGDIGDTIALNTINFSGGIVSLANVRTAGGQTYSVVNTFMGSGNVIAGGTLTLMGGGDYTLINAGNQFGSLIADAGSINLTDAEVLTLNAIQLASGFTASDAAGFKLIGPLNTTTGNITLTGPVTLLNTNNMITNIFGNVTINGLIDGADAGAQSLTVSALAGTVTLGNIGTQVAIDNLTINAATQTLGQVVAKGMQNLGGSVTLTGMDITPSFSAKTVTLTGDGGIDTSADNGTVDIGTLNGAFGLGINAGTGLVIIGTAGNITPLKSLSVTGGLISLGSITTTGDQIYTGNILGGTAVSLASGSGSITFKGTLGTATQRLKSLNITSAANVTLFHDDAHNIYYSLFVDNFTASMTGALSLGIHSLESDGDVSILSASVDGRIVTTGNVGVTTGSLSGEVAGNNVNINASGSVNANISGGAITVAANDFSGSATATRSASITAVDTINANVSAPVATLTAGNTVQGSVSGGSVTINAPNVNEALNEGQVTVVNAKSASLTGVVGGSTDLSTAVDFVPAAPIGTGNNGQPLSAQSLPQSVVNASQVAQNTTTATEDDVTAADQADGTTTATTAKKKSSTGQNCDPKKDGACTTQVTSTYDYANKYVDKLLSGSR